MTPTDPPVLGGMQRALQTVIPDRFIPGAVMGIAYGLNFARLDPEFALRLEAALVTEAGSSMDEADRDIPELIEAIRAELGAALE